MRFSSCEVVAAVAFVAPAAAQQLSENLGASIQEYPSFSVFRSLLEAVPDAFNTALSDRTGDVTVFIPTDEAFQKYLDQGGISDVSSISSEDLNTFLSYHIADKALKGADFDVDRGLVVPTLLNAELYNNRTAGPQIIAKYGDDATGQVLFATQETGGASKLKRQTGTPSVTLRAGLAQDVGLTVLDGSWGNKNDSTFQAIDGVLSPPRTCSTTIRSQKERLSSLDAALNKTELYPALDTAKNVTCLAPTTEAFGKAKNPENSLDKTDLTGALLAHTLSQVTYTNYLEDGMILETLNNSTVTVHIKDGEIYFNNAKIIEPNVLTNNGLIHILDAVIEPEEAEKTGSSSTGVATATSTPTTVPTGNTNAAGILTKGYSGAIALFAVLALM